MTQKMQKVSFPKKARIIIIKASISLVFVAIEIRFELVYCSIEPNRTGATVQTMRFNFLLFSPTENRFDSYHILLISPLFHYLIIIASK